MIVSHRHGFIFLKPRKVAGTSVEVALSRHCGDDDIITPVGKFEPAWDEDEYVPKGRKHRGFSRHASLDRVRRKVGAEVWDRYHTFSIARNPWDLVVSQYHWATRGSSVAESLPSALLRFVRRPKKFRRNLIVLRLSAGSRSQREEKISFETFARSMLEYYPSNDLHYFDRTGSFLLDRVLRFESLAEDFDDLCAHLGLPASVLPSLKTKARKVRRHYSEYYTPETRDHVARFYRRQIEQFGYSFEAP